MQTNFIVAKFVNCKRIISVPFEDHSIHTSTAGVHKSRSNRFCKVAPIIVAPQYGTSFMLIFRWREFLCVIYISVKFEKSDLHSLE